MKLVVIGLSLGLTLDRPKPGHFSGLKTLILGMGLCSIQALTQLFEKGLENQSFNNSNVRGLSRLGPKTIQGLVFLELITNSWPNGFIS